MPFTMNLEDLIAQHVSQNLILNQARFSNRNNRIIGKFKYKWPGIVHRKR